LKKRTKKLLSCPGTNGPAQVDQSPGANNKSFLVLFSKKNCFLPVIPTGVGLRLAARNGFWDAILSWHNISSATFTATR
jgi:hypothetical protein